MASTSRVEEVSQISSALRSSCFGDWPHARGNAVGGGKFQHHVIGDAGQHQVVLGRRKQDAILAPRKCCWPRLR